MIVHKMKEDLPLNNMTVEPNISRLHYKRATLKAMTNARNSVEEML
jgi:hypothetical protein